MIIAQALASMEKRRVGTRFLDREVTLLNPNEKAHPFIITGRRVYRVVKSYYGANQSILEDWVST